MDLLSGESLDGFHGLHWNMLVSGGLHRTPPGINMPIWPLSHQDIPGFREFPAEKVGECTVLDMIDENFIIVYMDNIFLFAPDEITLAENTKRVLARLQENDLFLKPTKCEFNKTRVEYLGMVIEEGKISMDPGKLRGIRD